MLEVNKTNKRPMLMTNSTKVRKEVEMKIDSETSKQVKLVCLATKYIKQPSQLIQVI